MKAKKIGAIAQLVKEKRKSLKLTQPQFVERVGVGLRFLRELEQGKKTLQLQKVNQVLNYLGYELGPIPLNRKDEL